MGINPFDYKDLDYNDYIKALDEPPKTVTTVIIDKTEYYNSKKDLPKVSNDLTIHKKIVIEENKTSIEVEKPHEYAKSKEGVSVYHQIKHGETLKSIAKAYNVTVTSIMKLNKIRDKNDIKPKQTIRIL